MTKDADLIALRLYDLCMESPVRVNPKVMHGTPCFTGTRVAIQSLIDHLEAGHTIEAFLDQFPTVRREKVNQLLEGTLLAAWKFQLIRESLLASLGEDAPKTDQDVFDRIS